MLNLKTMVLCLLAIPLLAACGKDGATGPQGPAGVNGLSGADNKIVATMNCLGEISGLTGAVGAAINGLWIGYSAALTGAGDVYASGFLRTPSLQVGDSAFYSANQNGATTGAVIFTADVATSNYGFWNIQLDRTTLVVTAVYTDESLGADSPVTVTFLSSACQSHSY